MPFAADPRQMTTFWTCWERRLPLQASALAPPCAALPELMRCLPSPQIDDFKIIIQCKVQCLRLGVPLAALRFFN